MSGPPRAASRIGQGLSSCGQESMMYGICIARNINNVQVKICDPEFQKLKQCFTRSIVAGRKK